MRVPGVLADEHRDLAVLEVTVGARAEHPQTLLNRAQLGTDAPETGPADYMLAYNPPRGERSAYTFCMCPGGEVVAAGTEQDGLTVNGMCCSHRAQPFGNAAVVVTVRPEDFGAEGPLAGIEFQRRLERMALGRLSCGRLLPSNWPAWIAIILLPGVRNSAHQNGLTSSSIRWVSIITFTLSGRKSYSLAGYCQWSNRVTT